MVHHLDLLMHDADIVSGTQTCPCGLTGANCTALESPLTELALAQDQLCSSDGFKFCIVKATEASCQCQCGYTGDLCGEVVMPLQYNFGVGITVAIVLMTMFSTIICCKLRAKAKKNDSAHKPTIITWGVESKLDLNPYHGWAMYVHLGFRVFCFILFLVTTILGYVQEGFKITMKSYTYWNWVMFGFVFFIATIMSGKHIKANSKKGKDLMIREPIEVLEKGYIIGMEVIWPDSFMIAALVWILFVPPTLGTPDQSDFLNNRSYIYHLANVFLITIEFFLVKLRIRAWQCCFVAVFGLTYTGFHIILMFAYEREDKLHCPVYDFLDMSNPTFVLNCIGVLIASLVLFFILFGASKVKERYAVRYTTAN